jgi:hypothetical protein
MMVWIREEQAILWHDMRDALDRAINGAWSMAASNIARRIVQAAKLVGPTDQGAVPYSLAAGGVYAAVLTAGGVPFDVPSEDEWLRYDGMMGKYGTTRESMVPQYAATVAEIQSERETNWIAGDDE